MTNPSRDTARTGKSFEYWCQNLLEKHGYNVDEQINIGLRPHGGEHNTDLIVNHDDGTREIVSCKYQEVQGTAESKIVEEQCDLQHAVEHYGYKRAIIVLAGNGWRHKDALVSGCYSKWVTTPDVKVVDYDTFHSMYCSEGRIVL